jgi:hypothetical protein
MGLDDESSIPLFDTEGSAEVVILAPGDATVDPAVTGPGHANERIVAGENAGSTDAPAGWPDWRRRVRLLGASAGATLTIPI